jgi:hypothetical protein
MGKSICPKKNLIGPFSHFFGALSRYDLHHTLFTSTCTHHAIDSPPRQRQDACIAFEVSRPSKFGEGFPPFSSIFADTSHAQTVHG